MKLTKNDNADSSLSSETVRASHGGGVNNSGDIVGWEAAADASTWYLIPVDEAVAEKMIEDYAPIRDRDIMLASVASMVTTGSNMLDIARDLQTERPAITTLQKT